MAKIFVTVFATLFVAGGAYCGLGAWLPRFHSHWKGSNKVIPPLSCAGFGLFFICLGLLMLCGDSTPRAVAAGLLISAIGGWILIAVGAALDARTRSFKFLQAAQ
jgi:hypothetical protein